MVFGKRNECINSPENICFGRHDLGEGERFVGGEDLLAGEGGRLLLEPGFPGSCATHSRNRVTH